MKYTIIAISIQTLTFPLETNMTVIHFGKNDGCGQFPNTIELSIWSKLQLARQCYPHVASDQFLDALIMVYIVPTGIHVESKGMKLQTVLDTIQNRPVVVELNCQPYQQIPAHLLSMEMGWEEVESAWESLDATMTGSCLDEDGKNMTLPNQFVDFQGTSRRQFVFVYVETLLANCSICPKSLQPEPSPFKTLSAHCRTAWHRRYLAKLKFNRQISPETELGFEAAKSNLDMVDAAIHRVHIMRESKHVRSTFGYYSQKFEANDEEKMMQKLACSSIQVQCAWRCHMARASVKTKRESKARQKADEFAIRQRDVGYIWQSAMRDLCNYCNSVEICPKHR